MIIDTIENLPLYDRLHPHIADVRAFIRTPLPALDTGRHSVNTRGTEVIVSTYVTKPASACCIEAHNRFIDVQLVLLGSELVGYAHRSVCIAHPYDAQKDFVKLDGAVNFFSLLPGMFALFFPHDGHMPGVIDTDAHDVKKAVFKIPV